MRHPRSSALLALAGLCALLAPLLVPSQLASAAAPMIGVDRLRTSWDPAEPGLSPGTVGSAAFGTIFTTQVSGQVYAQPITAGNKLLVATEANQVYGLDPKTGAVGWQRSVGKPWSPATLGCGDLTPTIGVTSTPVHDEATGTVYLTAKVDDGVDARHPHWYMHALDAATGVERAGWPYRIEGMPTNDPARPFNPLTAMQRPGLLLLDGVVYAAFASHCDAGPFVGYVVGVDAVDGELATMWASETGGSYDEGGIWQSGGGLVSDGPGSILLTTGNGLSPAPGPGTTPPTGLGESVVRLRVQPDDSLTATDFFSPSNNAKLDQDDFDLGSGAPLALPDGAGTPAHPHLLVQIGKDGRVYLLDRDNLGGMGQGPGGGDAALGVSGPYGGLWGHPAYFGGGGGYVYVVENNGYLRAHAVRKSGNGTPSLVSVGTSTATFAFGSGSPVVTSVGSDPSTALVWVTARGATSGTSELRAYDAIPDSSGILRQRFARNIGSAAKFTSVATDQGRVFVGTQDGGVWGFAAPTTASVSALPTDFGQVGLGRFVTRTVTVTATRAVTLTEVKADGPFGVSWTGPNRVLAAGQTLDIPVSFTPSEVGQISGSLTMSMLNGGKPETTDLSLGGYGSRPGLAAFPGSLDFGDVVTGAAKQLSVSVSNVGTAPVSVTGVRPLAGPFRAIGLPTVGATLAPQASLSVAVLVEPTAAGELTGSLALSTNDGPELVVPLSASAVTGAPRLEVPEVADVGAVPVGLSVVKDFSVTNTGNLRMTVTKAKAPAGSFTSDAPLPEGLIIAPGDTVHQSVRFTPSAVGPVQESYILTTDDGTGAHTVALRGTGIDDPITVKYVETGRAGVFPPSLLGNPLRPQQAIAGGKMQEFTGGNIYWSAATGAHVMKGRILARYLGLGGPAGPLGFPTTDELAGQDGAGRYNDLVGGSVYWSVATDAHDVVGPIRDRWRVLGGETGPFGYPTTGQLTTPDGIGRYNHFAGAVGASIYWTAATGAHAVQGAIRERWAAHGWEKGPLGYPISDELPGRDGVGRVTEFAAGSIYWSPETGAHEVHGSIRAAWLGLGGEVGPLGYPVTSELPTPGGFGRYNHFAGAGGASVYWTPATGAHAVQGAIREKWAALGWERGPLGYPATHERPGRDGGGRVSDFTGGSVYWSSATGAHEVRGSIRQTWLALGGEVGPLGYPVTDELPTPDGIGRFNHFAGSGGASVYWTGVLGAHGVYGGIRALWAASGWELGPYGYPVSDEYAAGTGRRSDFERGSILWP